MEEGLEVGGQLGEARGVRPQRFGERGAHPLARQPGDRLGEREQVLAGGAGGGAAALPALERLAARFPVAALTNGNADLARIGIHGHFRVFVSAREQGIAKPEAPIFHATCERLGVAPHEVLHVGDDPLLDVHGARRAGLRTCWINRKRESWPLGLPRPDLEFATLAGLADWLDARHPAPESR